MHEPLGCKYLLKQLAGILIAIETRQYFTDKILPTHRDAKVTMQCEVFSLPTSQGSYCSIYKDIII